MFNTILFALSFWAPFQPYEVFIRVSVGGYTIAMPPSIAKATLHQLVDQSIDEWFKGRRHPRVIVIDVVAHSLSDDPPW